MTDTIRLAIPATAAWIVLVRTAVTACCARLDFDVDRLEDLRLAVDEVAGLLVDRADDGAELVCVIDPHAGGHVDITLATSTSSGALPPTDTFAWAVLTALVDDITTTVEAGTTTITLRTSRSAADQVGA